MKRAGIPERELRSTQPLKPPRRIWIKTRRCACGDCQIIPRKHCPAIDELNPGEWMYVSAEPRN